MTTALIVACLLLSMTASLFAFMFALLFDNRLREVQPDFARATGVSRLMRSSAALISWSGVIEHDAKLITLRRWFYVCIIISFATTPAYELARVEFQGHRG